MRKATGILGGGQSGCMLNKVANRLNMKVLVLDAAKAPAEQIDACGENFTESFKGPDAICQLASTCDILIVEIEHLDAALLKGLYIKETCDSIRKT